MKKVLVISSTPRIGGNSERLAEEFLKGAKDSGNDCEIVYLRRLNLGYCRGCYQCSKTGKCFQNDGMNELAEKLKSADAIMLATPVYFYTMSGQLKVMIDRLVPHYLDIHADIYMCCTAWDPDRTNLELTIESIRGCTRDCLEGCIEKGYIICPNVQEVDDIDGREELKQVYNMGKNV